MVWYSISSFSLKWLNNNKPKSLEKIDKYILIELNKTIENVKKSFQSYKISAGKREIENFFWHTFADNYLEIIKNRIYNASGSKKQSAQFTLYNSLLAILKMISPITPFITEEIYQTNYKRIEKDKSIHISNWPEIKIQKDKETEKTGDLFIRILAKVRQAKSQAKKPMNAPIILHLDKQTRSILKPTLEDLKAVTASKEIKPGEFKVEFI